MKREKTNEKLRIASAIGILGFISWGFFSLIIILQGEYHPTLRGVIMYIVGISIMILINILATEVYESK